MASGYTPCACRDCFDIAVSDDDTKPDLCHACESAGCEKWPGEEHEERGTRYRGTRYECQRDDAYGAEDFEEDEARAAYDADLLEHERQAYDDEEDGTDA